MGENPRIPANYEAKARERHTDKHTARSVIGGAWWRAAGDLARGVARIPAGSARLAATSPPKADADAGTPSWPGRADARIGEHTYLAGGPGLGAVGLLAALNRVAVAHGHSREAAYGPVGVPRISLFMPGPPEAVGWPGDSPAE